MSTKMRLSDDQIADLALIRDLGTERIRAVVDRLEAEAGDALQVEKLRGHVVAAIPDAALAANAEALVRQSLSLAGLMRHAQASAGDIVAALSTALERTSGWDKSQLETWVQCSTAFRALLEAAAVKRVAKAIELTYEYANLLQRARILVDVRPLFDDDADRVEGAVVSFTLRLLYDSADGNHGMSVALDEKDVRDLQRECERALKKALLGKEIVGGKALINTIVAGGA